MINLKLMALESNRKQLGGVEGKTVHNKLKSVLISSQKLWKKTKQKMIMLLPVLVF